MDKPSRYRILMLRAWEVQDTVPGRSVVWRYGVKGMDPAEWQHFADLEELIAFLRTEFGDEGEAARKANQAP
jgi:hypothetical protein